MKFLASRFSRASLLFSFMVSICYSILIILYLKSSIILFFCIDNSWTFWLCFFSASKDIISSLLSRLLRTLLNSLYFSSYWIISFLWNSTTSAKKSSTTLRLVSSSMIYLSIYNWERYTKIIESSPLVIIYRLQGLITTFKIGLRWWLVILKGFRPFSRVSINTDPFCSPKTKVIFLFRQIVFIDEILTSISYSARTSLFFFSLLFSGNSSEWYWWI